MTEKTFERTAATAEALRLYHAWLGYLLTRLGTDTLRVRAEDIRHALDTYTCTATREGDMYVIRMETARKEESHGEGRGTATT